jgi:hypothetical protein
MNKLSEHLTLLGIQHTPDQVMALSGWMRQQLAHMVADADCRDITYTSFDQAQVSGIKNRIITHIFKSQP